MAKDEVSLTLAAGKKRVGKTNESLKQLLYQYVGKLARRSLIFDPNNEYSDYVIDGKLENGEPNPRGVPVKIAKILPDQLPMFNRQKIIEIRRLVPYNEYGLKLDPENQAKLIIDAMQTFKNGCLLIDDLNTVFGDSLPTQVSGFLTNNAHRGCDIILHVQDIGRILPKMWQNIDFLRMHKMYEGVDSANEKLSPSNYQIFKIMENMVEKQYDLGNRRFSVTADRDQNKIKGNYTTGMLLQAVQEYVEVDANHLIKRYLNILDNNRKSIYSYADAKQRVKTDLFKKYLPTAA